MLTILLCLSSPSNGASAFVTQPRTANVDLHDPIPEIEIDVFERLAADIRCNRCVIDQSVNPFLASRYVLCEGGDRSRISKVERKELRNRTCLPQFIGDGLAGTFQDIAEHEARTVSRAGLRNRPTNAARRASHNDGASLQQHLVRSWRGAPIYAPIPFAA